MRTVARRKSADGQGYRVARWSVMGSTTYTVQAQVGKCYSDTSGTYGDAAAAIARMDEIVAERNERVEARARRLARETTAVQA